MNSAPSLLIIDDDAELAGLLQEYLQAQGYAVTLAADGESGLALLQAAGVDLVCSARILKLGRALAVGDCLIHSVGQDAPVARASLTYSIPPER